MKYINKWRIQIIMKKRGRKIPSGNQTKKKKINFPQIFGLREKIVTDKLILQLPTQIYMQMR